MKKRKNFAVIKFQDQYEIIKESGNKNKLRKTKEKE